MGHWERLQVELSGKLQLKEEQEEHGEDVSLLTTWRIANVTHSHKELWQFGVKVLVDQTKQRTCARAK
jgi:hypothetical protein